MATRELLHSALSVTPADATSMNRAATITRQTRLPARLRFSCNRKLPARSMSAPIPMNVPTTPSNRACHLAMKY